MRTLVVLLMCAASVAAADPSAPAPKKKAVAEAAPVEPEPTGSVLLAGGASEAVDRSFGALPSARIGFYFPNGFTLSATAAAKTVDAMRESSTALLVGYRLAMTRGALDAWAGVEAGGGVAMAGIVDQTMAYSPLGLVTPYAGASARVWQDVRIGLELTLPEAVLRKDGAFKVLALPAGWLGVLFDL